MSNYMMSEYVKAEEADAAREIFPMRGRVVKLDGCEEAVHGNAGEGGCGVELMLAAHVKSDVKKGIFLLPSSAAKYASEQHA